MASSIPCRDRRIIAVAKILSLNQLEEIKTNLDSSVKIVLAGGCFDILHIGHLTFLEKAKEKGDILIILLESDQTIKRTKGANRPIHTQHERAYMLSQLTSVDYVILLPQDMENKDYDNIVKSIQPAIIATTEGDIYISHKERQAQLVGAKVLCVNKIIPKVSTSKIVEILSQEE